MKTKFFKKLSFVLVVAMVLSLFVPAAGAFAAKAPKLNSTNKYLHLGVDKLDEYNFNVANKQKGWKYYWESANENVAVVNEKNGVTTATGVGKTKVTLYITNADGEKVQNLSATVTVRDNIKEVTIKNPVEGTLAVGAEHDFNRNFVTVSGSTKKTSAITRWTVEPSENATIDEKGVFVATKAGEYTVTALSFQSKARYNNWLKDDVKYADYVLDTDTTKVVVGGSMVAADQVNADTVKVSFDSVMEDVKDLNVYQMVGTTKVKQLIKEAKLADDKKSANVTLYIPFTQEATYIVEYPEMEDVSFAAARMKAEDVAYIKVDTSTAVVGESKDVVVKLFNANDVDISAGEGLSTRVTMEAEEVAGTHFDGKSITIFEKNTAVKVTATYHTYEWDNKTGEELGNLQDVGIIIGVDEDATNLTGINAWTIVGKNDDNTYSPDFDKTKQIIAAEDKDFRLFVKFNTKTGSDTSSVNSNEDWEKFEFESSNDEVLIVSSLGDLHPNKQGVVTVVVKYGEGNTKTPVGAIQITVSPKAKASNLILGNTAITLSNVIGDSKEVTLELKDQAGRDVAFGKNDVDVLKISGPEESNSFWTKSDDGKKVIFDGTGVKEGRYSIKITVKDVARYVTVNVVTAKAGDEVVKYVLELGSNKVDLKAEDKKVDKSISINLFGLAANGTKISEITNFDGVDFKLLVDAPHVSGANWDYIKDTFDAGNDNTSTTIDDHIVSLFDGADYTLADSVSGSTIRKAPVGNYKVTAYERKTVNNVDRWVVIDTKSFVVEDTQALPTVTKVKTLVFDSVADVKTLVADCFEIKLNGEEMTNIVDVDYNGTNTSLYIKTITVRKAFTINNAGDVTYIDFEVNVGRTIRQK